jgi:hypothetical protein
MDSPEREKGASLALARESLSCYDEADGKFVATNIWRRDIGAIAERC